MTLTELCVNARRQMLSGERDIYATFEEVVGTPNTDPTMAEIAKTIQVPYFYASIETICGEKTFKLAGS